jgi:hypothetical protein
MVAEKEPSFPDKIPSHLGQRRTVFSSLKDSVWERYGAVLFESWGSVVLTSVWREGEEVSFIRTQYLKISPNTAFLLRPLCGERAERNEAAFNLLQTRGFISTVQTTCVRISNSPHMLCTILHWERYGPVRIFSPNLCVERWRTYTTPCGAREGALNLSKHGFSPYRPCIDL